jgi:hypothetical protein
MAKWTEVTPWGDTVEEIARILNVFDLSKIEQRADGSIWIYDVQNTCIPDCDCGRGDDYPEGYA